MRSMVFVRLLACVLLFDGRASRVRNHRLASLGPNRSTEQHRSPGPDVLALGDESGAALEVDVAPHSERHAESAIRNGSADGGREGSFAQLVVAAVTEFGRASVEGPPNASAHGCRDPRVEGSGSSSWLSQGWADMWYRICVSRSDENKVYMGLSSLLWIIGHVGKFLLYVALAQLVVSCAFALLLIVCGSCIMSINWAACAASLTVLGGMHVFYLLYVMPCVWAIAMLYLVGYTVICCVPAWCCARTTTSSEECESITGWYVIPYCVAPYCAGAGRAALVFLGLDAEDKERVTYTLEVADQISWNPWSNAATHFLYSSVLR